MRAAFVLVLAAACSPDIVSGSYLCGPDSACPEGLACNGPDNTCVLSSTAEPFACEPDRETEPDDTSANAHVISGLQCVSVPYVNANCMLQGDTEDWVKFTPPASCTVVAVSARVSFTVAFARLGLELWNLDTNTQLGVDTACPSTGEEGEELRCLNQSLTPGTNYGIKVRPAGDGNCGGNCSYNRYTLSVKLGSAG